MKELRCTRCNSELVIRFNGVYEGTRVLRCQNCHGQMLVHWKYMKMAPGHEEHEYFDFQVKKVNLGKNARCACGSGRAYGKCCGAT